MNPNDTIINQLSRSISSNNIDQFNQIISCHQSINLNAQIEDNSDKDTLLHVAAKSGKIEFVKMLIGHGINIHAKNKNSNDALYSLTYGCRFGHVSNYNMRHDIIKYLIDAGADVLTPGMSGRTALMNVCRWKPNDKYYDLVVHKEIIGMLLDHDSDRSIQDVDGCTMEELARRESGLIADYVRDYQQIEYIKGVHDS